MYLDINLKLLSGEKYSKSKQYSGFVKLGFWWAERGISLIWYISTQNSKMLWWKQNYTAIHCIFHFTTYTFPPKLFLSSNKQKILFWIEKCPNWTYDRKLILLPVFLFHIQHYRCMGSIQPICNQLNPNSKEEGHFQMWRYDFLRHLLGLAGLVCLGRCGPQPQLLGQLLLRNSVKLEFIPG